MNGWKQPIPTNLESFFGEDYFSNLLYRELIYRAANKDGYVTYKNKTTEVKRGQVIFGRNMYAKYLCCDDMKCERTLNKLCEIYKITSKQVSNHNFTIVTLLNYDELVGFEQASEQPMSKQRASSEQPMSTSKSVKSEESIKSDNPPKGEMAISEDAKIDWEYWETQMAPITRNQIFHKNTLIRLKKAHGRDNLHKMIRLAAAAHEDRFASQRVKPSTPKELEDKWDALMIWGKSKYTQQTTKILDATS